VKTGSAKATSTAAESKKGASATTTQEAMTQFEDGTEVRGVLEAIRKEVVDHCEAYCESDKLRDFLFSF